MTDQEKMMLVEASQRSQNNEEKINSLEDEMREIRKDQKAIYKIATSVELIAQRVGNIEEKIDDTSRKVDAQGDAWQEAEKKLSEKMHEIEERPYKQTSINVNSIKTAIITAIFTFLATGILSTLIKFGS